MESVPKKVYLSTRVVRHAVLIQIKYKIFSSSEQGGYYGHTISFKRKLENKQ